MAKKVDDSKTNRLTDIIVKEVSLVDRAANKRSFLVTKRDGSMSKMKMVSDGRGGFTEVEITKSEAGAAALVVPPTPAVPAAAAAPAALSPEQVATEKAEVVAKLGGMAGRFLLVAKALRDDDTEIPETLIEEAAAAFKEIIAKRRMGKARMDKLESGLATLQDLMAELKGETTDTTKAAAAPVAAPPAVPAVPAVAAPVETEVTKALAELKATTEAQAAEIRKLRETPTRPNSGPSTETTPATGDFAWPSDMAAKKRADNAVTF